MRITVTSAKGKPLILEGKKIGPFLVHQVVTQYEKGGPEYKQWNIVHIGTGLMVPKVTPPEFHFPDEEFAIQVAKHFSKHPFYTSKVTPELTKDEAWELRQKHADVEHKIQDRREAKAKAAREERQRRRESAVEARTKAAKEAARKGQAVKVKGKWGMGEETIPIERRFGKLAVHRGPEGSRSWWRVTHIPSNVSIAETKSKRKAMTFAEEAARTLDLDWKQLKRLSKKRKDALRTAAMALSEKHGVR